MHGRVAAGKITDIAFDDEGKRILVAAQIVDDDEWRKVQEGVYTGFSQGGRYVKRWPDPDRPHPLHRRAERNLARRPALPARRDLRSDQRRRRRETRLRAARRRAEPEPRADASAIRRRRRGRNGRASQRRDPPAAEAASPSDALAKAASALSLAADKLERAVAENWALRKSVATLAPKIATSPSASPRSKPSRCPQAPRCARLEERRLRSASPAAASTKRSSASPPARAGARARAHQAQPRQPASAALLTGSAAMLVETLRADWTARATNARVRALPEFENGALALGAGTKLAEVRGDRRDEATEGERAVALVSVALGRPLDASSATHVRRALAKAREGDAPLALTHLALAGAGRLTTRATTRGACSSPTA